MISVCAPGFEGRETIVTGRGCQSLLVACRATRISKERMCSERGSCDARLCRSHANRRRFEFRQDASPDEPDRVWSGPAKRHHPQSSRALRPDRGCREPPGSRVAGLPFVRSVDSPVCPRSSTKSIQPGPNAKKPSLHTQKRLFGNGARGRNRTGTPCGGGF
jgi:hypothetical protein